MSVTTADCLPNVAARVPSRPTSTGRGSSSASTTADIQPDELSRIFATMDGEHRLFAQLLYGTGLRITEGLQLRVKDVDFEMSERLRHPLGTGVARPL